jgi:hypothetical protein
MNLKGVFKAAAIGAGVAVGAAAVLPVVAVGAPVIAAGAVVGGLIKLGKNNQ